MPSIPWLIHKTKNGKSKKEKVSMGLKNDAIAKVKTNANDKPLEDVKIVKASII